MKILEDVNMSKVDVVEILKKSDALLEGLAIFRKA